MNTDTDHMLTRRQLLGAASAAPLCALLPGAISAAAPMLGAGLPPYRRFQLGAFEVTTLLAGNRTVENPHSIFGTNVSKDDFDAASAANFIPSDAAQFFFTPTLVNTGEQVILFDTGLNGAGITAALSAAGYTPDQVDQVVITHMHGDHIGGLAGEDGTPTFANATYVTGAAEMDHWDMSGNENFENKVRPLQEQFTLIGEDQDVAGGVTSVGAFGHTPGHMAYHIESEGKRLLLGADFANHYVYSLAHPDWEVRFDMDKEAAAATRRTLLDMISADKIPFVGYHMPFPALGYVEAKDGAYRYVPASYQQMI